MTSRLVFTDKHMYDHKGEEKFHPRDVWIETDLDSGWRAAFRMRVQGGAPVVAEVRVFPAPQERRINGHNLVAGEWEAEVGGARAPAPAGGLSARVLRRVALQDALRLTMEKIAEIREHVGEEEADQFLAGWGVDKLAGWGLDKLATEASRRPGPAGRSDRFYAEVANAYVQIAAQPHPVETLAGSMGRPTSHVRQLLNTARERGLLSAAPRGRAGGELTEKALAVLRDEDA